MNVDPLHCRHPLALLPLLLLLGGSLRAEIVLPGANSPSKTNAPGLDVPTPGSDLLPEKTDLLEFLSGDRLRGTFLSINTNNGVRWRHPAIRQVLDIRLEKVSYIRLARPETNFPTRTQQCLIRLANDDELFGELMEMDATNVTLQTWYAGRLVIPRLLAKTIAPGQLSAPALYEGPTSLEGWKVTKPSSGSFRQGGPPNPTGWIYRDNAFYGSSQSTVGRDLKLPPLSSIEFDLAWSGYLHVSVGFYTDNLETYSGNCYMLQFSSGSVYLQRMTKDGNSSNLGHAEASALSQKSKARIAIRSNKEQKTVSLFLDGALLKQWNDRAEFPTGSGLTFFQQGQGLVRLSRLRVSEWDGKLDAETKPDPKSKEDYVKLANNDKITGTLKTIREGKMSFGTEFATLEVPVQRIALIELASDPSAPASAPAPALPSQVRAVFTERGSITLQLERWDAQQIVGHIAELGQVKFLPAAFSRIDFNLQHRRNDPDLLDFGGFFDNSLRDVLEN